MNEIVTNKGKKLIGVFYALALLFAGILACWLIFAIGYVIWSGATVPVQVDGLTTWQPVFREKTWLTVLSIYFIIPLLGFLAAVKVLRTLSLMAKSRNQPRGQTILEEPQHQVR